MTALHSLSHPSCFPILPSSSCTMARSAMAQVGRAHHFCSQTTKTHKVHFFQSPQLFNSLLKLSPHKPLTPHSLTVSAGATAPPRCAVRVATKKNPSFFRKKSNFFLHAPNAFLCQKCTKIPSPNPPFYPALPPRRVDSHRTPPLVHPIDPTPFEQGPLGIIIGRISKFSATWAYYHTPSA